MVYAAAYDLDSRDKNTPIPKSISKFPALCFYGIREKDAIIFDKELTVENIMEFIYSNIEKIVDDRVNRLDLSFENPPPGQPEEPAAFEVPKNVEDLNNEQVYKDAI